MGLMGIVFIGKLALLATGLVGRGGCAALWHPRGDGFWQISRKSSKITCGQERICLALEYAGQPETYFGPCGLGR